MRGKTATRLRRLSEEMSGSPSHGAEASDYDVRSLQKLVYDRETGQGYPYPVVQFRLKEDCPRKQYKVIKKAYKFAKRNGILWPAFSPIELKVTD